MARPSGATAPFGGKFVQRLLQQVVAGNGAQRVFPDGFQATALLHTSARWCSRPTRPQEVEGRDHAHHAHRVPGFHHAVAGAFAGNRQAMQLARQSHGEVADVDHLLHLAQPSGAHLAASSDTQQAQGLFVLAQFLAQAAHQFAAPRGGHGAPLQEGGVRALDERLGLRAGVAGELGVHGAVAGARASLRPWPCQGPGPAQLLQNGVKRVGRKRSWKPEEETKKEALAAPHGGAGHGVSMVITRSVHATTALSSRVVEFYEY